MSEVACRSGLFCCQRELLLHAAHAPKDKARHASCSYIPSSCILSGGRLRRVQDVSALTGDGLRAGLQWLVDQIRKSDRAVLLRQRN